MKELTYQVPRRAYAGLLEEMIRRNDRRPLRVAAALLLTVGQMAVVAWLCVFRLEPGQRAFFLGWSLLLAGLTVLRRRTARQRANGTLQRLEYTGQLPPDYWKDHHLRITETELRLRYGDQTLSCPLYGLSRVEEREDALFLRCGETIFDIVPESAFPSREAMGVWAEALRTKASGAGKAPQPEAPEDAVSWTMEERDFLEGQYQAYRILYYRYRFLRPATFLRLAVSVAAAVSMVYNRTPVSIALSAAVLLLANVENISMVPALCRLRIRRELGEWKGGGTFRLSLGEDALVLSSDRARAEIPLHKINLCQEFGDLYLIAWSSFPAVVMPRETARTAAAPLLQKIQALQQG
ncbi:hypothetical protein [uncultured Oscillibacter sp.]|uniref:hypothetical protein n=1 Tax=uncultured Oscillibacter sp. TaxID=876091 RepID=UPI0026253C9A|nr:hypothetical protein [uncultured Oscillibacter sp.]